MRSLRTTGQFTTLVRVLAFVWLLGCASSAQAQPEDLQTYSSNDSAVAMWSFPGNVTAGSIVLMECRHSNTTGDLSGVTSSRITWTERITPLDATGHSFEVWSGVVNSSGSDTINLAFTSGTDCRVRAIEIGMWTGTPTFETPVTNTGTGTAIASGSVMTVAAGYAVAFFSAADYPTFPPGWTAGTGWTAADQQDSRQGLEHRATSATTSYNGEFTWPESINWAAGVIAIGDGAGGGGGAGVISSRMLLGVGK